MALILFIGSILGFLPIILWLVFFLWQDINKPEPLKWLLIIFGLGILITPLVWYLESFYFKFLNLNPHELNSLSAIILAYVGVAFIEELTKFFSAYLVLKRNKYFDEAIDAMIYLIVLALGFGLVENILAATQELTTGGLETVLQITSFRFIGANLLHVLSSGIIGFFWALSLIKNKRTYLCWGLLLGMLLHFIFDFVIIKFGGIMIFLISVILFVVAWGLLWAFDLLKKIKKPIKFI